MGNQFLNTIFKLEDKVVAVTGACGQLGSAICKFYTDAGATVIGMDVSINERKNDASQYIALDIRKRDDVKSVLTKIFNEYGQIDILVNNAGVSTFEPFEERPEDRFDWVMDVNLKGTFNCIQKYVELYDSKKMDKGCIINIASMYGSVSPDPSIYQKSGYDSPPEYGSGKAAIIQFTKYIAIHNAKLGIRVNSISPGAFPDKEVQKNKKFINNLKKKIPMGRIGKPDELKGVIIFLASNASSYVTGENIHIDGGWTAW